MMTLMIIPSILTMVTVVIMTMRCQQVTQVQVAGDHLGMRCHHAGDEDDGNDSDYDSNEQHDEENDGDDEDDDAGGDDI